MISLPKELWLYMREKEKTQLAENGFCDAKVFHVEPLSQKGMLNHFVDYECYKNACVYSQSVVEHGQRLEARLAIYAKTLESCLAAMTYAYEDRQDQYYLNVKKVIKEILGIKDDGN